LEQEQRHRGLKSCDGYAAFDPTATGRNNESLRNDRVISINHESKARSHLNFRTEILMRMIATATLILLSITFSWPTTEQFEMREGGVSIVGVS
jgi:hypothetical protein